MYHMFVWAGTREKGRGGGGGARGGGGEVRAYKTKKYVQGFVCYMFI